MNVTFLILTVTKQARSCLSVLLSLYVKLIDFVDYASISKGLYLVHVVHGFLAKHSTLPAFSASLIGLSLNYQKLVKIVSLNKRRSLGTYFYHV